MNVHSDSNGEYTREPGMECPKEYTEQTKEEWLRSASSTEELAERIFKCAMANSWAMNETQFKSGIRGWLKEKHNEL